MAGPIKQMSWVRILMTRILGESRRSHLLTCACRLNVTGNREHLGTEEFLQEIAKAYSFRCHGEAGFDGESGLPDADDVEFSAEASRRRKMREFWQWRPEDENNVHSIAVSQMVRNLDLQRSLSSKRSVAKKRWD